MENPLPALRVVAVAAACAAVAAHAALQPVRATDLADLTLEQLTQVNVTSVTRRPERLSEAPASIHVITREEIRRSGATSLPEALRLAPNLHVARTDASQYAISARGGNVNIANKMLVMVDGRTIYSPLFSGVFWDVQDVLLEDVERIEVVSGPAGTLWGTNGMNGVISITTLPASRTPGTFAAVGAGRDERLVAARFGAAIAPQATYRVYARHHRRDAFPADEGGSLGDGGEMAHAGFRLDWQEGGHALAFHGDAYEGDYGNLIGPREVRGANLVGRWQGAGPRGTDFRLQAYYDRTEREQAGVFGEVRDTFDIEFNRLTPLAHHALVWGGGYRASRDRIGNTPALAFLPARRTLQWANVFLQDEVALGPALKATLGLRLEHNSYTGLEWLPNARIAWQPAPQALLWAAASRAVRAPSRIDRDFFVPGEPPHDRLAGGPGFESEVARVLEVGYRGQVRPDLSFSATAFSHRFDDLRSVEARDGRRFVANGLEGRLRGVEAWGAWQPAPNLRLSAGLVLQHTRFLAKPGVLDFGGLAALGNDPRRMARVRVQWDPAPSWQLDVSARHVGRLPDPVVPAYSALDARLGWQLSNALELSLHVVNLLDRRFAEFESPAERAVFDRAWFLRLAWRG